jgi:uncharacterized protein (TIGR02300 family)
VAKAELGTKRVCPTTGRKFYDLDRDPIVSPYTGQAFPRSTFEPMIKGAAASPAVAARAREVEEVEPEPAGAELVPLEEVEAAEAAPEAAADDEIDIAPDVADTFLEEEEEAEDDVVALIDGDIEDDEEA